jgi:hypothetical protein
MSIRQRLRAALHEHSSTTFCDSCGTAITCGTASRVQAARDRALTQNGLPRI